MNMLVNSTQIANDETVTAAAAGSGSFVIMAIIVAIIAFALVPGLAEAFRAATTVATTIFMALLRVGGIGVLALVVAGLLLL